ncbi:putative addiction module killer protein [Polynucleobacter meluiroseus]|uniref:Putative addiction module killer protein n=2 Tax=Polynucleobacter meluiroseus TaxID=1938814 RepID=A0A240E346_9BURK|nr:putative addiction module killer protein [Polynucleobacter meluiroseus]
MPETSYCLILDKSPCIQYSFDYNLSMYTIKETPEFQDWLDGIRDLKTRIRLAKRLAKVRNGNLGDTEPVGDGISEMREHFGPGWRMYYIKQGKIIIVMLGGGDKSTQAADIKAAKKILKTLGEL